jgi:aminomethyltransferase
MKRTPLYEKHQALGARIIDFGGWAMPVQYAGILKEHKTVRTTVGLFDVSHMGEALFSGVGAAAAVQKLVTNDVGKLVDGGAMYTVVCYPDGGIVDDCIVYRQDAQTFLIVINAGNVEKDLAWFRDNLAPGASMTDLSDETALLAVQGPHAVALLSRLSNKPLDGVKYFSYVSTEMAGIAVRAARTGYTGEDGFEIFVGAADAPKLWDAILETGQADGIAPIGLGARDTLRLEARLPLYGNDIDAEHSPLQAGLGWVVKGHGYIGEEALTAEKARGVARSLVGFIMPDRCIARHGHTIVDESGAQIGVVTSGAPGPTVGKPVALGYVPSSLSAPGTQLTVDIRGNKAHTTVHKGPFYKRAK